MEFAVTEAQQAVLGVVTDVLEKDDPTWEALATSGLLGLAVPEEYGGDGLGLAEVGVVLRELGRAATWLPYWETICCGVLPLTAAGSAELQARLLPGVVGGTTKLAAGLSEPGAALPDEPTTTLIDGALHGRKVGVGAPDAAAFLVPATREDGSVVVAVVLAQDVELVLTESSRGVTEATLILDGVQPLDLLDASGWPALRRAAVAGLALIGDGLVAGARDLTAGYIKERVQFGRALAEFQAVAMQIADVYITSRTMSLAAAAAAQGNPDDLAVAAHWFCAEVPAAIQTCHHLHGGMGLDVTYPLPRYYSWAKDVARLLGGSDQTLDAVPLQETDKNPELSDEQRAFKQQVRGYFENLVTRDEAVDMMTNRHGDTYHDVVKRMGRDGWMGVGWPKEYGGHGLGPIEQQIFVNEAARSDVHLPSVTLQTVGPTLQAFGTQKQKDLFLGAILRGDVHFAIGYSEPDAGTDLASLKCTARRDGDHYVVNGQKTFTTGGHAADYIWLAVRTDPDAPKHKGISVLIVDTKDPGYSWTPIITADGSHHVNATYYQDVRVPVDMLVGEENRGWELITTQLNHERVMLAPAGRFEGLRDLVHSWAAENDVLDSPDVRAVLARLTATFRVNELLNWQVASGAGLDAVADSSASKVFAADLMQSLVRELEAVVHRYADPSDPETAYLMKYLDIQAKRFLVLTFGGGVNEVQRELIAMFGLKLPRVPR
ncbi:MAG TPA: acyl-CoA dehydrogenase [Nocardioidaceae bacterium]|nr:acyl-CoA dehydrogenase [Nocardioidaceae bacterium]